MTHPTYRVVRPDSTPSRFECAAQPPGHEARIVAHAARVALECPEPLPRSLNARTDDERRLDLARYLRKQGPSPRHRLSYAVRVGREKLLALLAHPWFETVGTRVRLSTVGGRELRLGMDP